MSLHKSGLSDPVACIRHAGKKGALFLIRVYQIGISPITGGRAVCRFTPTCSEYTRCAIEQHGVIRGTILGLRRISRCRPGGGFGYDPVP